MKKLLFFAFIATTMANLSCQNQNIFPTSINNSKTDKHINIPGTRLFIIPPNGFKISSAIPGIEKEDSGVIQVSDLVGSNFYSNSNTVPLNKEDFEKKGAEVFDYNELTVNGFHAKMGLVQGFIPDNPTLKSYYLVFGDSSFITMVLGSFFPNDTITDREIKIAMLTIVYNKTKTISPFETAEFMLDDSKSILKFADFTGGVYIYTIDGLNQASYYPMLIAM